MKEELKVGIVGANRGSSFIAPFTTISETKVTTISDISENVLQGIGEKFGIHQRFTQYEEMLDQVDIASYTREPTRTSIHTGTSGWQICD